MDFTIVIGCVSQLLGGYKKKKLLALLSNRKTAPQVHNYPTKKKWTIERANIDCLQLRVNIELAIATRAVYNGD